MILPFRTHWGDPWAYVQLGWGGILGAQFGIQMGVKLALASTLAGFLLILPLVWYRFHGQNISNGPIRLVFYSGSFILVAVVLALRIVE